MRPDLSASVDVLLDRFTRRWLSKLAAHDRRVQKRHRERVKAAMSLDDPRSGLGAQKPSLTDYDGHVETHGQD